MRSQTRTQTLPRTSQPAESIGAVDSDVNASTAARLGVAWEWAPREKALSQYGTRPGNFQATPLRIDHVLYFSTP
mgnify:CR=1 FL=1